MKNYLKSYRIHLKVVGPVFIGSGKELSKKEYLFYKNNQIAVIDIAKFYLELKKIKKLDSFEAFMLDEHEHLGSWIILLLIDVLSILWIKGISKKRKEEMSCWSL